jgi:hypothetical protein
MTECDEIAATMRGAFFTWLAAEERELTHYAAQRFVCAKMTGESAVIRSNVAEALFRNSREEAESHRTRARIAEIGSPLAGSW